MASETERTYPSELPVVALRETVVFPLTLQPLAINRPMSIDAVNRALSSDRLLFLTLQTTDKDEPEPGDLRPIGTIAAIRQMAKVPTGGIHIIVEGLTRAKSELVTRTGESVRARVVPTPDVVVRSLEVDAHVRRLQELIDRGLSLASGLSQELRGLVSGIDDPLRLTYLLSSLLDMKADEKQHILEEDDVTRKLEVVSTVLSREIALLEMKNKIESAAQQEMTDAQRQYYLRQQLKAIQDELGEGEKTEIQEIRARVDRREPAGIRRHRRAEGSRSPRADDAGLARIPDDPDLHRLGPRRPVVDDDGGSAGSGGGARGAGRGPLRSRQGQGAHRRVPRGAEAEDAATARRADQGTDSLLRRPARRRQDVARPVDRAGDEPEVRPHLARRRPRRGGDPRASPHLHRRHPRPDRAGA